MKLSSSDRKMGGVGMSIDKGDIVRVKFDMVWVDGTPIVAGSVCKVRRLFMVKTESGIEPRVSLEWGRLILPQVRLDQIERCE